MTAPTSKAATSPATVADKLENLARRVGSLVPSHRRPEEFHESKSELVGELRRLAREARHG